jgi:hypothetical protein
MEPTDTPDPYDFNPADAGTDRPEGARPEERQPESIRGVTGILALIPRDCPEHSWATVAIPENDADPSPMTEVGAVITREALASALDRAGVKVAASDTDALMAALGYALAAVTGHLIFGAVVFAKDQPNLPKPLQDALALTAKRMGKVDQTMAPMYRLIESLVSASGKLDAHDNRAHRTSTEIIAGSTVLSQLVRVDTALVACATALTAAAADSIAAQINPNKGGDDATDD